MVLVWDNKSQLHQLLYIPKWLGILASDVISAQKIKLTCQRSNDLLTTVKEATDFFSNTSTVMKMKSREKYCYVLAKFANINTCLNLVLVSFKWTQQN